jgi:outer membrane protein assembly factor BamB
MRAVPGGRIFLGLSVALLLGIGAVAGFKKLDRERFQANPDRLRELAETPLPPTHHNPSASSDWPQWRGPHRDGVSNEAVDLLTTWPKNGPRVLWKKAIGRGFSSLAIAGGRLFTMSEDDTPEGLQESIVCWDANTGAEVWRFRYANHYDERFGSGPRSTPAVEGGFVYAVGPTGIFHCLRAENGRKVWRYDLMEEFHGRSSHYGVSFSPLVEGNLVYTMPGGPNGNSVAAFDKRTGALVWKALDDPIGYSSPLAVTAAGVRQVLFFTNSSLVSLSPSDGKVFWRFPWITDNGFNIATPVTFGNYVFISSAYGKGCALLQISANADGTLQAQAVYEHNRMRNHFASSVRHHDHLYGFDRTDLVCMDVRSGQIVWREQGNRSLQKGSLLIAGNHLIVLGEHGKLALAEATPAGYREQAAFQVSRNKCWTVPAFAGGRLYVRDEGQITCLDLRR